MINYAKLHADLYRLRNAYASAQPFPLVIIDDFLTPKGLAAIRSLRLPSKPSSADRSSDWLFAKNKLENPNLEQISDVTAELRLELLSEEFKRILCSICGQEVFLDPDFIGGGLHQGMNGSFLDMHVDFTHHPIHRNWLRELNLLLYLNPEWSTEYGGCLDLMNSETGHERSIEPIENRMVIMMSKRNTVHGYRPIRFPDELMRTSIAAYAYRHESEANEKTPYRSTWWHPSNRKRALVAPLLNRLTPLKQYLLGSRTAKRRQK